MRLKLFIIISLSLLCFTNTEAQRVIGELETNVDQDMVPNGGETDKDNTGENVPTEVHAWTVDEIFGNKRTINVDTLTHAFQNHALSEGMKGEYNTLSNLGSPRINRIFMERNDNENFIFLNPFDQFTTRIGEFRHFNTKSPYMNITYDNCGSKTTGWDNFAVVYTQNVGKKVNFGAQYKYMYGQGYYNSQSTGFMNTNAWASYNSDRYVAHFQFQHNYMKMAENGGISDETYITHPENQTISYASNDIPTYLSRTWNRQEHNIVSLTHHYNLGFERVEGDSTNRVITFVPVMKIFHSLKVQDHWRNYKAYTTPTNYHSYTYIENDSTCDRFSSLIVRNNVGISFCEGFHKWAVFGLNAYVGYEHRSYTMANLPDNAGFGHDGRLTEVKDKENEFLIGGQMIRTMGKYVHYNVDAEFVISKENTGQFFVKGHGEVNIPFLKDTLQIAANAYIKNERPSYYYRHYHSKHAWWDKNMEMEFRQRAQIVLSFPKSDTRLTAGFENIKNYTYMANEGTTVDDVVTNNVVSKQYADAIQVYSATLDQNFAFGPVHLDNSVTFQYSSNKDVLPLPTINTYNNLYLKFTIAKVLKTELGADVRYFTEYYAPDYSPVVNMFTTQNQNKLVKIGNYPLVSAYVNCELKRLRFYVQYYHANAGAHRSFWAPGYPMNPAGVHFGLSWNFYD